MKIHDLQEKVNDEFTKNRIRSIMPPLLHNDAGSFTAIMDESNYPEKA